MALKTTFLGHGCFAFELDGKVLIVDPFFTGNPAAVVSEADVAPNLIVVSHGHEDHIGDTVAIAKRTGCRVVSNFEICEWLKQQGIPESQLFAQNTGGAARHKLGDEEIEIKLTIAFHSSTIADPRNGGRMNAGNPCGVVLRFPGATVYHAADTALFSDMKLIGDEGIDLAIVPIGDCFTMGPDDSVKAVKLIRPKRVIPDHYNTWPVIAQDAAAWAKRIKQRTSAKPIVLKPGESCEIGRTGKSKGKQKKVKKSKGRGR